MKQILVPTDFSEPAGHAADAAVQLALKHGASVHLIHSVDVPDTWQDARFSNAVLATRPTKLQQDLYPEVRQRVGAARQRLEDLTMRMTKKKVKATYHVAANAAWRDIVQVAKDMKVDLVIMGTHGAGALKEATMGSNAQRVVRMAEVPVLTLHRSLPRRIANVALFLDPMEAGVEKVVGRMVAPLAGQPVRYNLVRVNTPGDFLDTESALEALHRIAKRVEPSCLVHTCDHYTVAEGAVAFAHREGADMIALPTHGRQGLRSFLTASVAETIVNHSTLPVLTLRTE